MARDRICVGVVTGSFGVRGEARVKSFCAEPTDIANYGPLWNEDGSKQFPITLTRPVKGGFAARLGGIGSKEAADASKGLKLFADRAALPSLPDDEFYHSDLIGLDVIDTGGEKIGRVNAIHDHGAGDLLEVTGKGIKGSALIPFTSEVVPTVDLNARRVIVDLPEGLLPEAKDD